MASKNSNAAQKDQIFNMITPNCFSFKSHTHSSSFVSNLNWTKHKYWFIPWQKCVNKKQTMQICSNKSKSSKYICTHYCQCYFQIYVTCKKTPNFYLTTMLVFLVAQKLIMDVTKLQKMWVPYISTHHYGVMVLQIPTQLYKHCMVIRIFHKIWLII